MEDEFDDLFRKDWIGRISKVDQQASDFRRFWDESTPDERTALKEWINSISSLNSSIPRFAARVCLRVEFEERIGDDEFRRIEIPIECIKMAIEAFERGEPYCVESFKELF